MDHRSAGAVAENGLYNLKEWVDLLGHDNNQQWLDWLGAKKPGDAKLAALSPFLQVDKLKKPVMIDFYGEY